MHVDLLTVLLQTTLVWPSDGAFGPLLNPIFSGGDRKCNGSNYNTLLFLLLYYHSKSRGSTLQGHFNF